MIVLCLVLDKRSDLGPLLYLVEEVFLLELHSQPLMARTTNLYAGIDLGFQVGGGLEISEKKIFKYASI